MSGIVANSSSSTMTSGDAAADQAVTGYIRNERVALGVTPAASSSYLWAISLPAGSSAAKAALTDATASTPAFVPDIGGTYTITCQVDGGTTYAMRLTALDTAASEPAEALRFTPRADAQVGAPSAGVAVYYSSTVSDLARKLPNGTVLPIATESTGWIDLLGPVVAAAGATNPSLTAWSSPHGNFKSALFAIGDQWQYSGHVPHGIDAAAGVYLHAHVVVDGTQTGLLRFSFEYCYAHGYSRQAFSAPATATAEQAATGTTKSHQIIEIATPILVGLIEPDGIVKAVCTRVTNGGTDVTNNVFVEYFDAHARLLKHTSTNRNYPFEPS